jgi:hypothetical protein
MKKERSLMKIASLIMEKMISLQYEYENEYDESRKGQ